MCYDITSQNLVPGEKRQLRSKCVSRAGAQLPALCLVKSACTEVYADQIEWMCAHIAKRDSVFGGPMIKSQHFGLDCSMWVI